MMMKRSRAAAPKDGYHIAYGIVFLQGLAALLPWNLFITASAYFAERFYHTPYAHSFLNWFSMGFNLWTLLAIFASTSVLRPYMPSIESQIIIPLSLNCLVLFTTTIIVKIPSFDGIPMFWFTLSTIAVASISSAMLQGGFLSLLAKFPERYTQAFMAGQGLAGVLVACSNFILTYAHPPPTSVAVVVVGSPYLPTLVHGDSTIDVCAFSYFLFGFLVLAIGVIAFGVFQRLPITQYYYYDSSVEQHEEKLLPDDINIILLPLSPIQTLKQLKWYAGTVFSVFAITLTVFPSLVSSIQSINRAHGGRVFRDLYTPLLFVLFNVGDLTGRCAAGYWAFRKPRLLFSLSLSRSIFIVLFMMYNDKSWLQSDILPLLSVLVFSFTNGYFSSLAMMQSPSVLAQVDQQTGAYVMVFMLSFGLTCGSAISFLL